MDWLFLGLIAFVVIAGLSAYLKTLEQKKAIANAASLYEAHEKLFTDAERSFLGVLEKAVGEHAKVFGKVRVGDVLQPKKGLSRSQNQTARNKVDRKHFDYVLCDPEDLAFKAVIELNDKSHQKADRNQRDRFLQEACDHSGIPMIQVDAKASYSINDLKQKLSEVIPGLNEAAEPNIQSIKEGNESSNDQCPKCGSELVTRVAKKGEHAGKSFIACSSYPKCRYLKPIESTEASN
jgi:hypothetical protein